MEVLMLEREQLAIFIWGIDTEYNVTYEMASLVPLKNRIKYLDLYEALETTLKLFSLTCVSVCGTAVDDTLATIVKEKKRTYKINERLCNCCWQLMFDEISLNHIYIQKNNAQEL